MLLHISLCTLKKEIKKIKLEFVTKDKFDETGVKRIVTITNAEENEFEGSVLECAAKFTIIVKKSLVVPLLNGSAAVRYKFTIVVKKKNPWLCRCPSCSAAARYKLN